MINLVNIGKAFSNGRGVFKSITPSPVSFLKGKPQKLFKMIFSGMYYNSFIKQIQKTNMSELTGAVIAGAVIDKYVRTPVKSIVLKGFEMTTPNEQKWIPLNERHLFFSKRTWFPKTGKQKLVLIYHEATHKHVDIHFEDGTSLIIRVSGKPVESEIKFNKDGVLTEKSKLALMNHIRGEIANNSRVPQNYDHDFEEARMSWYKGEEDGPAEESYGSGRTRQIISIEDIEILKIYDGPGQNVEMYAPSLNSNHLVYIHKLYPGDEKTAPITIFGTMTSTIEDKFGKLHLKYEKNLEKFKSLVDPESITEKLDGSASAVHITAKSTRVFSHRIGKETGKPIEYTGKLGDLIQLKGNYDCYAETIFEEKDIFGRWQVLPSSKISGILNSNKVLPDNIRPRLYLYRVDKFNGENVTNLSFAENRKLQYEIAKLHPTLDVVPLASPVQRKGIEGYVGVPFGKSINEGVKFKFKGDEFDWKITSIDFSITDKDRVAGVVHCVNEAGKAFKLGPAQMGNFEFCKELMAEPEKYIGRVIKVDCLEAHEGRSAKFKEFHQDK